MRDHEMVAAIMAGDPAGLAAAYDRYAAALYAYCRSLLSEPADAADAVHDTFVIAASKLAGLRDPARLRPWLYAVARHECMRRLHARASLAGLDEASEMTGESADVGANAEHAALQEVVRAALAGLNPGERDVIELNLRHDLGGTDLAGALGVSPNHARALASRARSQFEACLGALLVARSGQPSCPGLDAMLAGWDGQLTVLVRKRINRHINHCDVCTGRKERVLNPAALLSTLPVVVLAPGLRERLLTLVADPAPAAVARRAVIASRAGRFGGAGFPAPHRPPPLGRVPHHLHVAGAGAVAIAALGGGLLFTLHHHEPAPGRRPEVGTLRQPSAPAVIFTAPATPGPASTSTTAARPGPPASPSATPPPGPAQASTRPAPVVGLLAASATVLTLHPAGAMLTGTFTLTAQGGRVTDFTVTFPAGVALLNGLTVTPSTGSLAAGQSVQLTVTSAPSIFSTTLTVDPGRLTVTVNGLAG